jgi:hypothetical protein
MPLYFIEPAALSVPSESAKRLSIVLSISAVLDLTPPKLELGRVLAEPPLSRKVMSVVRITNLDYLTVSL